MSTRIQTSDALVQATGRAAIYSLLALGFSVPDADRLELVATRILPAMAALQLPAGLTNGFTELAQELPGDLETWRIDHTGLFPPITSPDAPSYETAYRGDGIFQQTEILADIAGFYRAHGLRAGGTDRERTDHITVELEFMSVLARKTVSALGAGQAENAEICSDMGALFLQDHLGCWGPSYGRRAGFVSPSRWYRALGPLLTMWLELDMDSQGVTPVEVVDEPRPFEPPDDESCGPCEVPDMGAAP